MHRVTQWTVLVAAGLLAPQGCATGMGEMG